jgi:hypothetical protein
MKPILFLFLLAVLLPGLVSAQDDRHGDRDGNFHEGHANNRNAHPRRNVRPSVYRANRVAVSAQVRSLGVRSYPRPYVRTQLLVAPRERSAIAFPNRGVGGGALHANVFARTNFSANPVIRTHMALITGGAFRAQIGIYNANERIVGKYYWHRGNGFDYCHYYDRWGYHWYGWYLGNTYFWTRWYSNNWWWYDPAYYRWCYWHDGGWWWQDPDTTTVYVYNNGSYMPTDSANADVNVNVGNGQGSPSAQAPVQNQGGKNVYYSNDGSREVKVVGSDAFLYDVSGQNAFKPVYLGTNVTSAKFSNTSNGKPLQVMLLFSDGSFGLFDAQGNSINGGNNSSGNDNQSPANGDSSMDNSGGDQSPVGGNNNQPPAAQSNSPANGNGNPPPVPGSGT